MKFKDLGIILVSASSEEEAHKIASTLIEASLAACVTFSPMTAVYTWEGELNCNEEWQLIIKTDLTLFDVIVHTIQDVHSYEIPEIIALPIVKGSSRYLGWMVEELTNEKE
ncbi:divalent-cation tolerance protein CutA [Cyanobacterium stanieri LEGE 03274]|uniref:Divalent-cation tolerance protein CutA n=1 Tax=Cyanobacterium stanieri LEGE 03274 TaxID=1828756 RepID=A0ABR9V323_9CHRO|nr:divalent-cation tolerance protein CutA [Cyanobacterium stanieri]MBE9222303.1 divalent-cation tolerance protein CutA [Cyanobacterium stanieri LEGE 03274]